MVRADELWESVKTRLLSQWPPDFLPALEADIYPVLQRASKNTKLLGYSFVINPGDPIPALVAVMQDLAKETFTTLLAEIVRLRAEIILGRQIPPEDWEAQPPAEGP